MGARRRKDEAASPSDAQPVQRSTPRGRAAEPPIADADDQADGADGESPGEAMETRDRTPLAEALALDALDDTVELAEPSDDLASDATDEIAAMPSPDKYVTTDSGDRRPARDEAEGGFGAEPRSIDELADRAIGDAIPGRRGTRREGEPHGPDLGLR